MDRPGLSRKGQNGLCVDNLLMQVCVVVFLLLSAFYCSSVDELSVGEPSVVGLAVEEQSVSQPSSYGLTSSSCSLRVALEMLSDVLRLAPKVDVEAEMMGKDAWCLVMEAVHIVREGAQIEPKMEWNLWGLIYKWYPKATFPDYQLKPAATYSALFEIVQKHSPGCGAALSRENLCYSIIARGVCGACRREYTSSIFCRMGSTVMLVGPVWNIMSYVQGSSSEVICCECANGPIKWRPCNFKDARKVSTARANLGGDPLIIQLLGVDRAFIERRDILRVTMTFFSIKFQTDVRYRVYALSVQLLGENAFGRFILSPKDGSYVYIGPDGRCIPIDLYACVNDPDCINCAVPRSIVYVKETAWKQLDLPKSPFSSADRSGTTPTDPNDRHTYMSSLARHSPVNIQLQRRFGPKEWWGVFGLYLRGLSDEEYLLRFKKTITRNLGRFYRLVPRAVLYQPPVGDVVVVDWMRSAFDSTKTPPSRVTYRYPLYFPDWWDVLAVYATIIEVEHGDIFYFVVDGSSDLVTGALRPGTNYRVVECESFLASNESLETLVKLFKSLDALALRTHEQLPGGPFSPR